MREVPFSTSVSADGRVLSVFGVVDELSVSDLRTALHKAIGGCRGELAVDLTGVYFLPSLALGVFAGAIKNGAAIRLVAREGSVAARVLKITGLPHAGESASSAST